MKNLLTRKAQSESTQAPKGTKGKKVKKLSTLAVAGIVSASFFTGGALGAGVVVGVLDSSDQNRFDSIWEAANEMREKIVVFDAQEEELKKIITAKNSKITEIDNQLYTVKQQYKDYKSPAEVKALNDKVTSLQSQYDSLLAQQETLQARAEAGDQVTADMAVLRQKLAETDSQLQEMKATADSRKTLTEEELNALKADPALNGQ